MSTATKLQQLFDIRAKQFDKMTDQIQALLRVALEGSLDFIREAYSEQRADHVRWVGFALVGRDRDHVLIYAKLDYKEGETYAEPDGTYIASLSETEAMHLSQPFQIIMPVEIAMTASAQEIVEFFRKRQEDTQELIESWQGALDDEFIVAGPTPDDDDEPIIH
jgi:hypothetical protein